MHRPSISISFCLFLISLNFIINLGYCRLFNPSISTKDGAIDYDDQDDRYSSQPDDWDNRLIDVKLDRPTDSKKSFEAAASSEKEDSSNREDGDDDEDDVKAADNAGSRPTGANCQGASCQFQSVCGKAPLNCLTGTRSWMGPYMVNGEPVKRYGEWPSYALIITYHPGVRQDFACGGTLVSDRHILTAAHCMYDPRLKTKTSPENVTVRLGDHTFLQMDEQEKHFRVSLICVARGYLPHNTETIYDYAVLTLTDKVKFSNHYQPACLPHATNIDTRRDQCYLIGAGVIAFQGDKAVFPRVINQMRVRSGSCRPWGFGYSDRYRECFSKFNGKGIPCGGDSGGPVLCLDPGTKRWTVMAIVSYGKKECSVSLFGPSNAVYARITTMLPVISAECGI